MLDAWMPRVQADVLKREAQLFPRGEIFVPKGQELLLTAATSAEDADEAVLEEQAAVLDACRCWHSPGACLRHQAEGQAGRQGKKGAKAGTGSKAGSKRGKTSSASSSEEESGSDGGSDVGSEE